MEPESSSPPIAPPEQDPATLPDGFPELRVTMMEGGSVERFMTQVREHALEVIDFRRQWKEYEEAMVLMEESVRERVVEVKRKEEECDIKQFVEVDVMRLVLEMQTEERHEELKKEVQVKKDEVEARDKEVSLRITEKFDELKKREEEFQVKRDEEARETEEKRESLEVKEKSCEEMMRELEVRKQEVEARQEELSLFGDTIMEKSNELKKKEEEFQLKQGEEAREIEEKRKSLEVKEKNFEEFEVRKQEHEVRQKELSLRDETITEKFNELKKKEEEFQLKQKAEARDIEVKMNSLEVKEKNFEELMKELEVRAQELEARHKELSLYDETIKGKATELEKRNKKQEAEAKEIEEKKFSLELKEKTLEEREGLLELKEKELANRSKSRKRCRDEFESPFLAEKDVYDHHDPASASTSQAKGRETHEVACIDDGTDEEPEPYDCPDADFNSFNTTMSSFSVGQIWALYDPVDHMPRFYARIRKILEPQMRVGVRWLEPSNKNKPVPIACGDFKYGEKTTSSHLMFSHEMHHIITGKNITINPRKGETWALFSDWNSDNNMRKRPYRYDFVQVVSELDSDQGIGVAYLGRVEGFTSVYKPAERNGVLQKMIRSDEMLRFSHRVPSFVLTGDEKKGVPAGSFELDTAAIPLEALEVKQEESVEHT